MTLLLRQAPRTLRVDQAVAIAKLREAVGRGERRIVMQAPTGFGKTVAIADMAQRARAKGKRVLVTVPALSLVDQTVRMLGEQGVDEVGVIQAMHAMTDGTQPVQVASVQTLMRRQIPRADVVLVDECHKWFQFYERWFRDPAWAGVPIIGTSATPWTRGLGAYYGRLVVANTIADMIAQGTLAPFRVFAPTHPDLEGVRTVAGDYHEGDLYEAMRPAKLVADVVETWKKLGGGRPTICFAVNRDHARQLAAEFEAGGVPAGYMDCETPLMERAAVRARLLGGHIRVVCNVDVVGLGVDWPEIGCISYVRPTKSEMRYVQNIGRGLRTAPGKTDLVVIDHSDTTLRLGFVTEIHHEELDDGKPRLTAQKVVALPKECPACHYLKPPRTAKCPNCGFVAEHHAKPVATAAGELAELTGGVKPAPVAKRLRGKAVTYGQLVWYARAKGYRDKWPLAKYRAIYGVWPRNLDHLPHVGPPEPALASWIKAEGIRWAKGKGRAPSGAGGGHANGHAVGSATHGRESAGRRAPAADKFIPGTLMTEQDEEDFR